MRPIKDGKTAVGTRRTWEPPALTQLEIGAETKSARQAAENLGIPEPTPPASPSAKLGFSFEMALPLSARSDS